MLEIKKLTAAYRQDFPILENLDLVVPSGGSAGILGRNGAGKTTLARAIMNNLPYIKGRISWNGQDLLERPCHGMRNAGIGYFMQGGMVFPSLSVRENLKIAMPPDPSIDPEEQLRTYQSFIPFLSSPSFLKSKAGNLSGGERNILSLCMTLSGKPSLLVLDEPFAGISPQNVRWMTLLIGHHLSGPGTTMLLIDQNKEILSELCHSIYILKQNALFPFKGS